MTKKTKNVDCFEKNMLNNNVEENSFTDEFDKIWVDVVDKLIDDFISTYKFKKVNHKNFLRFRAKRLYKKYRKVFMNSYMYFNTNKIDKHKVASCLMKTILVIKPLSLSLKDKIKIRFKTDEYPYNVENILLANEYLSLSVAVSVLQGYIKAHNGKSDAAQPINHKIYFPTPFPVTDKSYLKDVCLDLYYINPHKFNTVTYANILFLLEKYSCRKVQCENLIEKCTQLLKDTGMSPEEVTKEICNVRFKERND